MNRSATAATASASIATMMKTHSSPPESDDCIAASWAMPLYAGFLRYNARVQAYAFLLPVPYPPFTLGN